MKFRKSEIIFYQILAAVFANCIAYAQICLLEAVLANVFGMLYILLIQAVVIVAWTLIATEIIRRLNPPEEMLIIYGSHLATEIVYKMSEMEERYKINESINTTHTKRKQYHFGESEKRSSQNHPIPKRNEPQKTRICKIPKSKKTLPN